MFGRRKRPLHEAVIVALYEIGDRFGGSGPGSDQLVEHPQISGASIDDLFWAIKRAREYGWLIADELSRPTLDNKWHDLRLSQEGEAKAVEWTRAPWYGLFRFLGRWAGRILLAVIVGVVAGLILAFLALLWTWLS